MSLALALEMQETAHREPLTRAAHTRKTMFFRQLGYFGCGLTVNK